MTLLTTTGSALSGRSAAGKIWPVWTTKSDLIAASGFDKVASAPEGRVDFLVASVQAWITAYTGWQWTTPPDDVLIVTKRVAIAAILADDESIAIARARGQQAINVAGDELSLTGPERFAAPADFVILDAWRLRRSVVHHVA